MRNTFAFTLFVTLTFLSLLIPPVLAAPQIQAVTGPQSGVTAWLIEDHSLPVIALRFSLPGGGMVDPPELTGRASMVASLMDEGAGELPAKAYRKQLENLAISLSFSASHEWFSGRLKTLSRNQDAAFELLALALQLPRFDDEGRTIQTILPSVRIFNLYVPNGGRDLSRVGYKLDFYQELLEICDQLHQKGEKIILCGDFNTAHQPIDLRNPEANQENTGFLHEERAWIDIYLEHGFRDIYRDLYPDREQYTWWTYRLNARQ